MNVPVMINYFIYIRMIGETPKWVQSFVFITPIIGKKQIKDMEDYTGEQLVVIISGLLICFILLVAVGKKYVDKITKK